MSTIWVYKPPHFDYYVAKRNSFGFHIPLLDRSGQTTFQIVQGLPMTLPTAWDWKQKHEGATFAGLHGKVYEITDLERPLFMFPQ